MTYYRGKMLFLACEKYSTRIWAQQEPDYRIGGVRQKTRYSDVELS